LVPPIPCSYKPETFETLAHEQTVDKLVRYFGYPEVRAAPCIASSLRGIERRSSHGGVGETSHRLHSGRWLLSS
jgi:hypothetical protein